MTASAGRNVHTQVPQEACFGWLLSTEAFKIRSTKQIGSAGVEMIKEGRNEMRCQKRLLNGLVESTIISIINECGVVDCNE